MEAFFMQECKYIFKEFAKLIRFIAWNNVA